MPNDSEIIWRPDAQRIADANVTRFMRAHGIADYAALLKRSCDVEWFWDAALKDLGVVWDRAYSKVLDQSRGFPFAQWFVDGELNIVRNCIDRHASSARRDAAAIVWENELGDTRRYSFAELASAVNQLANALLELHIGVGDAVGLFLPMIPEVAIAMFACQKIGAVAVPIFSGYGAEALAVRLADANARVVLTTDASVRKGQAVAVKSIVDAAAALVPTLEHVVVLQRELIPVQLIAGRDLWWHELVDRQSTVCATRPLPAESSAIILYTSGTTGRPKGCVHTHAGCLAQTAKELGYHFDVKTNDRFFWLTDIGWMMGPWELIGVLFHGATVVMFEGLPNFPAPDRLWQLCARQRVTHLGIAPTAIRVLKKEGDEWLHNHDLSALRVLGSTGEVWDAESYLWYFEKVGGARCPVMNISGGTEIIGCHLAPLPIHPLKACTLQGPGLGMDVDVFNEAGESVRGEIGYLVCKQPAPSMTKGFLNDRERYLETYFSKWPQVWNHGDWARVDADGFWFVQGRADDTIKVAGKRVGPAEIEGALMEHARVAEAAAIGVPDDIKGESIVCFVVLKNNFDGDAALQRELIAHTAQRLGKSMQPKTVVFVSGLPKTRSAKIVRGVIRKKWLGERVGDISMIENPQALDGIVNEKFTASAP